MNQMEGIILRERVITIKAGDTFNQALQGNVLRVTSGSVPLRVQDRNSQLDFTLLAGEKAKFPSDTPGLILSHTSGEDQTFTIQVGKGVDVASALLSGSVTISGTPTFALTGDLQGITNTVNVNIAGSDWGGSYKASAAMAANTPETVFSGASNTNGARVIAAGFFSYNQSNFTKPVMIAKGSSPVNINDGTVILVPDQVNSPSMCGSLKAPHYIRPGLGLFFISTGLEDHGQRYCLYEFL